MLHQQSTTMNYLIVKIVELVNIIHSKDMPRIVMIVGQPEQLVRLTVMVVIPANLCWCIIKLKHVMCAHWATILEHKMHCLVMNVLLGILQNKTIPKGSYMIDANRVLEAFLVLQTKPTICWKVATIAPVASIPKWKQSVVPINVKAARKGDGVLVLVLPRKQNARIVGLENMDKIVQVPTL